MIGIEHIGLCAEDPQRLAQWYSEVLGFKIVRALEAHRTYFIRAQNGGMLEIYPAQQSSDAVSNVHRGLRHIALTVSNIELEIDRLRSAGVFVSEETIVRTPEMQLAFFHDPEGNILHLVERKAGIL